MQPEDSTILLHVTHSLLKQQFPETRLDRHMTVGDVKARLAQKTGTAASSMVLELRDLQGHIVATLLDDSRPLGFYSPHNGFSLHIIDRDPSFLHSQGWLEDTGKVAKYTMSDQDYDKREQSVRKWKEERLKQVQQDVPPVKQEINDDYMAELAAGMTVGQRCSVEPGDRRGAVKFVGRVEGIPKGFWIGVEFDEPFGQHDGTFKGKQYFTCKDGFGRFVRPDKVKVGDYPPVDELDGLDSDDEI